MNKVTMIGRLTADPRQFADKDGELSFVRFSIAVDRRRPGEEKNVDFFDVTAFSWLAGVVAEYCKKGKKIAVSGRLEQSKYTTKDGEMRYSVGIIAEDVELLSPKKEPEAEPADEEPKKDEPEKKKYYPKH